MREQALIPRLIVLKGNSLSQNIMAVVGGIAMLSWLAQISIALPFTPVPITGQTFGVTLLALSLGKKRGLAAVVGYLMLGCMGLPVFALGHSGFGGPTSGYLIGMLVGSYVMGFLADQGWTKSFSKSLAAAYLGSLFVFGFGALGLSFFIPKQELLVAGVYPFLIGDFLKNTLSAALAANSNKILGPKG